MRTLGRAASAGVPADWLGLHPTSRIAIAQETVATARQIIARISVHSGGDLST
jgi:hypothetical protein